MTDALREAAQAALAVLEMDGQSKAADMLRAALAERVPEQTVRAFEWIHENGHALLTYDADWKPFMESQISQERAAGYKKYPLYAAQPTPDLLSALKELTDAGAEAWGEDRPCVKQARAALARAEGEA